MFKVKQDLRELSSGLGLEPKKTALIVYTVITWAIQKNIQKQRTNVMFALKAYKCKVN